MPQVGKYGRLPMDPERPRLTLERYLDPRVKLSRAGLPPVALTRDVDRSSMVPDIPMYLNNELGDCTIAALGHMFGSWTVNAGVHTGEALFSDAEITAVYSRVGGYVPGEPSTDAGCMMSDVLADARANGMTDVRGHVHKVVAYAAFGNPADEDLLGQALEVFGAVYVGFNVQQIVETEFEEEEPWTYQPGAGYIGGHCVNLARRYPVGGSVGVLEYWTWARRQRATFGWQANVVDEAWAPITEDWLKANGHSVEGCDLTQLLADMADV